MWILEIRIYKGQVAIHLHSSYFGLEKVQEQVAILLQSGVHLDPDLHFSYPWSLRYRLLSEQTLIIVISSIL